MGNRLDRFEEAGEYYDKLPLAVAVIEVIPGTEETAGDFIFRYVNEPFAEIEGKTREELLGRRFFHDVFPGGDKRGWFHYYEEAAFHGKKEEVHRFSPEIDKYLSIKCAPWKVKNCCICLIEDETDLVIAREQLEYMATMDMMTSAMNKNSYDIYVEKHPTVQETGILFVDVNGLKRCNDMYGHAEGDFLIRMVSDIIKSQIPENGQVFRMGGDEFVVVIEHSSEEEVSGISLNLRQRFRNMKAAHFPHWLAACGYAWTSGERKITELIHDAEEDMYEDKEGKGMGRYKL